MYKQWWTLTTAPVCVTTEHVHQVLYNPRSLLCSFVSALISGRGPGWAQSVFRVLLISGNGCRQSQIRVPVHAHISTHHQAPSASKMDFRSQINELLCLQHHARLGQDFQMCNLESLIFSWRVQWWGQTGLWTPEMAMKGVKSAVVRGRLVYGPLRCPWRVWRATFSRARCQQLLFADSKISNTAGYSLL